MLKLRRAIVVDSETPAGEQRLTIELSDAPGVHRAAIADVGLVGRAERGDELIVNVEALERGLGSGGFDIVHVNLTRGLTARATGRANVMKLNYTSLQHTVSPVEEQGGEAGEGEGALGLPLERPVGVLALHGQLAAVAWAFAQGGPGRRLGYVQTAGGALPGGHSQTVRELGERGLLAGHLTAGAAFGGEGEAMTTAGALHHGLRELGWDAAICGPGPGIVGSGSALGHGGMAALDSAHAALALGASTLIVARMSSGDERTRHRGISHHTLTVLDLLLEPVTVALPAGMRSPVGSDLRAGLGSVFSGGPGGVGGPGTSAGTGAGTTEGRRAQALEVERPVRITRHDWRRASVDLPAYAASGLPAMTMGRTIAQDPLFFGAALAGGGVLGELMAQAGGGESASGAAA
ncbi:MAG TPA: DUF3866 family protein [Solirubrobacteraceae bacterium]|jgi:hypothetical protein|nr:DUF3866 family protein [Solirubrobacteraceae bacterium]